LNEAVIATELQMVKDEAAALREIDEEKAMWRNGTFPLPVDNSR